MYILYTVVHFVPVSRYKRHTSVVHGEQQRSPRNRSPAADVHDAAHQHYQQQT